MILLVDIGNSEVVLAVERAGAFSRRIRIESRIGPTPDQVGVELERLVRQAGGVPGSFLGGVVASVVPPLTEVYREAAATCLGVDLQRLPGPERLGVRLLVDEPATVGEDRIANTVAVARLHGRDAVVVDLGTATTFDVITAAGDFLGGVIAPGVRSGAEQLFRRTALLPRVSEGLPARVIGRNTAECIRAGVYTGALAMIEGLIARIEAEWGRPNPLVIATGGLSGFIAGATPAVHEVDELLTLKGLAEVWKTLSQTGHP
ncbi:MAG: type III pantothenate kinase [Gemmatimonadetes bacterium]|nr:type III pantothenate kinase [Gemmatimonadota bacterium]